MAAYYDEFFEACGFQQDEIEKERGRIAPAPLRCLFVEVK